MPRKKTSPTPASKESEEVKEDAPVRRRRTLPKPETPEVDETPKTQTDQAPVEKRKTPKKTTRASEDKQETPVVKTDESKASKELTAAEPATLVKTADDPERVTREVVEPTGKLEEVRKVLEAQAEKEAREELEEYLEGEDTKDPIPPFRLITPEDLKGDRLEARKDEIKGFIEEHRNDPTKIHALPYLSDYTAFQDPLEGPAKKPKYTRYTRRNTWKGGDRYGDAR